MGFRTGSGFESDFSSSAPSYQRVQPAIIFENIGTFDSPHYRDVDWSVIMGGGLALRYSAFRVVLDTRFAMGLSGTFADADASFAHNGSWITTLGIELR